MASFTFVVKSIESDLDVDYWKKELERQFPNCRVEFEQLSNGCWGRANEWTQHYNLTFTPTRIFAGDLSKGSLLVQIKKYLTSTGIQWRIAGLNILLE